MTIKTLKSGSDGNCYILTSDNGKHLILDAGITIAEIKRGLNYDIENVEGCVITHCHQDHFNLKSAKAIHNGFAPVWRPYLIKGSKRCRTYFGKFEVESFDVPHNGTENRAFLIRVDGTTILYATDFEYIPYNLSKQNINVMLIEMNYQKDRIDGNDHLTHVVLGHAEEQTTIGVIKNNMKYLRHVILCHMSKSGALDRELAMEHIREVIPDYIQVDWARPNEVYNISEIPF